MRIMCRLVIDACPLRSRIVRHLWWMTKRSRESSLPMETSFTGQGGTISSFYQNQLGGKPGDFIVGFGNPDDKSVQYCEYDTECNNDGNQYCGDDLCPDGKPSKMKHKRNHYVTQGGLEFISTRDLAPGHRVVRMAKRDMEDVGEVAGLFARDVEDNSEAVDDEVMEQIWKE